jgi:hypothetical protein
MGFPLKQWKPSAQKKNLHLVGWCTHTIYKDYIMHHVYIYIYRDSVLFFAHAQTGPGVHPASSTSYQVFPRGKVSGAWSWPPTPFLCHSHKLVLHLYCPSGTSGLVKGWILLTSTHTCVCKVLIWNRARCTHRFLYNMGTTHWNCVSSITLGVQTTKSCVRVCGKSTNTDVYEFNSADHFSS